MKYLIFFVLLFMSGCYKDYINLTIDYDSAVYNKDSTEIAFIRFVRISQAAKGMTAFPDGGKPKVLFKDVSLFKYEIGNDDVAKIFSFGSLPYNKTRWQSHISFQGNNIAFSIIPLGGWENKAVKNDSLTARRKQLEGIFIYDKLKKKLVKTLESGYCPVFSPDSEHLLFLNRDNEDYMLNLSDSEAQVKELLTVAEINSYSLQWLNNHEVVYKTGKEWYKLNTNTKSTNTIKNGGHDIVRPISPNTIKKLLNKIPLKKRGVDISRITPKSDGQLMDDIVELNGSAYYRKAIIELLEPEITANDVQKILKRIDSYKKKLGYSDRVVYENAMEETVIQLKSLLK